MPYTKKSEIYHLYAKIFYDNYEERLQEDEENFLIKFTSYNYSFGSKEIFYNAVFRLIRWHPKFIIYIFVYFEFFVYFQKNNASSKLKKLIPIFSRQLVLDALRSYSKNVRLEKETY